MGASKGILRRLPLDPTIIMDYIPIDVVVNGIITTGYYVNSLKWVLLEVMYIQITNPFPLQNQEWRTSSGAADIPFDVQHI